MDILRLQYFLAVMEHRNFARAAEFLNVSQPAVTHAVNKLEKELMVRLFDRGRFGAVPTEFAETLEHRARLIMAEMELAKSDLASMRGAKKGRLSVGIGTGFASRLAPKVISEFVRRWPDISIHCEGGNTAALKPMLLNGAIDLMLVAPPLSMQLDEEIATVELFDDVDKLTVRAGHPLLEKQDLQVTDLVDYTWLVSRNVGLWRRFRQIFQDAGVAPPETLVDMSSATLGLNTLIHSDAIALLGTEMSHAYIERGELAILPVEEFVAHRKSYFCYRKRSPMKLSAKNFLSLVKKYSKELYSS